MAKDAGLEFVPYWQHDFHNDRNNYLFRKLSSWFPAAQNQVYNRP